MMNRRPGFLTGLLVGASLALTTPVTAQPEPEEIVREMEQIFAQKPLAGFTAAVRALAPAAGETAAPERLHAGCQMTWTFARAAEAMPVMDEGQLSRLEGLDPVLANGVREVRASRAAPATSARTTARARFTPPIFELPTYPNMNAQLPGFHEVVVHYCQTNAGEVNADAYQPPAGAVTGTRTAARLQKEFAERVRTVVATARVLLQNKFRAPYLQDHAGTRFHVYIRDLSAYSQGVGEPLAGIIRAPTGFSDPRHGTTAKAAVHMLVSPKIETQLAGLVDPYLQLTAALQHEYMHAIQFAYNGSAASPTRDDGNVWMMEGTATLAAHLLTPKAKLLEDFLRRPDSVCLSPGLSLTYHSPLSLHAYSSGLFLLSVDTVRSQRFARMRSWFEAMDTYTDSLAALQAILGGEAPFRSAFADYLARLYLRSFPALDSGEVPAVPTTSISDLNQFNVLIENLGAEFFEVQPSTAPGTTPYASSLLGTVASSELESDLFLIGDPTSVRAVRAVGNPSTPAELKGFANFQKAVVIVASTRPLPVIAESDPKYIDVQLLRPAVQINFLASPASMVAGTTVNFPMDYDLVGLPGSLTTFPVDVSVSVTAGNTISRTDEVAMAVGTHQQFNISLSTTGTNPGTLTSTIKLRTPAHSFSPQPLVQSTTSFSYAVDVVRASK